MKNIMLIAPPAAGKGTQAALIEKKYKIPHIATGDILREISKEDSEIGKYVFETMASGELVKNDITYKLIEERLKREDCKNGFIVDGFPRNLEQAKEYDKILKRIGYKIGNVIVINVDKEILEKRITGRRICEKCNTIYNINDDNNFSKDKTVCQCGGQLYQRSDDNLDAFETRYQMYLEQTIPIIEHYRKKNVLKEISGDDSVENIFNNIDKIINT